MEQEKRSQDIDPHIVNSLLTKEQRQFNGEWIVFWGNDTARTGYPDAKYMKLKAVIFSQD